MASPAPGDNVRLRTGRSVVEESAGSPDVAVVDLTCMDNDAEGPPLKDIRELDLDTRAFKLLESIRTRQSTALGRRRGHTRPDTLWQATRMIQLSEQKPPFSNQFRNDPTTP